MQVLALLLALAPQDASATLHVQPQIQNLQALGYTSGKASSQFSSAASPVSGQVRVQSRGFLGVAIDAQGEDGGILAVESVVDGSPAQGAGLKVGDRLVALNGRKLANHADLIDQLGKLGAGKQVELDLERLFQFDLPMPAEGSQEAPKLGVSLNEGESPIGVVGLSDGMPAQKAGIRVGDRILSIDSKEVASVQDVVEQLHQRDSGTPVRVRVLRKLPIKLGSAPAMNGMPSTAGQVEEASASEESGADSGQHMDEVHEPHVWTEQKSEGAPDGSNKKIELRYRLEFPQANPPVEGIQPQPNASKNKSKKSKDREVIVLRHDGARGEAGEMHEELQALRKELMSLRKELKSLREEMKSLRPAQGSRWKHEHRPRSGQGQQRPSSN